MLRRRLPRPIPSAEPWLNILGQCVDDGGINLTSPVQSELEEKLICLGFTKPDGIGHPTLGWIHPSYGWDLRWLPARRWMERRIRWETGNEHGIADLND